MNDFFIQGVTILGSEPEKGLSFAGLLFILFMLFLGCVVLVWAIFYSLKHNSLVISLVIFGVLCLTLYAVLDCIRTYKTPSIIYTVSIDDTASYNEIKNNFYSVKELPNGLYEVTLKSENN